VINRMDGLHEIVGAFHLHSEYSDGSLGIPEIAELANEKALDFLMFSDHNTLEPKRKGLEGWYGNVLVLIGCEINDPQNQNHYLAFRIDEEIEPTVEAGVYVKRVRELGGFGVIAHPAEKRSFSETYPPYPWTDWDVDGFDGIEIWNQLSEWMEGVTRRNIAWRIFHPLRSIRFPVEDTLERWDRLNLERRVVGLGGIDVHGFKIKLFGFIPVEIYPYKVQFRSIRMHLLTRKPLRVHQSRLSFDEAETQVYNALSEGRCFISNFRVGDAQNFRFWAEGEGQTWAMGSRVHERVELSFFVETPLAGNIRLLRNGQVVHRVSGKSLSWRSDMPGVYRTEVFRMNRGWIYSNPIVSTVLSDGS